MTLVGRKRGAPPSHGTEDKVRDGIDEPETTTGNGGNVVVQTCISKLMIVVQKGALRPRKEGEARKDGWRKKKERIP